MVSLLFIAIVVSFSTHAATLCDVLVANLSRHKVHHVHPDTKNEIDAVIAGGGASSPGLLAWLGFNIFSKLKDPAQAEVLIDYFGIARGSEVLTLPSQEKLNWLNVAFAELVKEPRRMRDAIRGSGGSLILTMDAVGNNLWLRSELMRGVKWEAEVGVMEHVGCSLNGDAFVAINQVNNSLYFGRDVILHERAHSYDFAVFKQTGMRLSSTPAFLSIHDSEKWTWRDYEEAKTQPKEFFALSLAAYLSSASRRAKLRLRHPKVCAFFDGHFDSAEAP